MRFFLAPAFALLAASTSLAAAQTPEAARLKSSLDRLNAASARFSYATAAFHKDLYNALVKEHTPQDGSIYFLRAGSKTQMGARITGQGARTVEYKDGTLRDFNPGIQCFDTVSAAGNQARIESFLTLGFGGSGTELAKAWDVRDQGPETLDGTKVERFDITPRDASVKGLVTHAELWIDLDRGVSLKQVFYSPSGDVQTATYTNIDTRKKPDLKQFEIKGKPCGK